MAQAKRKDDSRSKDSQQTPLLEWVLGAIGALLLLSAVSFLVYEGVVNGEKPGEVVVSIMDITETEDAYVVRFRAHNSGSQTLGNLQMQGQLSDGDAEVEVARVAIDYLPGQSSQEAGIYFRNDPRSYTLNIRPEGFQKP